MKKDIYSRSRQLFHQGESQAAVDVMQQALESNPDDGCAWELLGLIRHSENMVEDAVYALETATLLKPLSICGQLALASCYLDLNYREAGQSIYLHLADNKKLPTRYIPDVTVGLSRLGNYQRALSLSREAARQNPECDEAQYAIAYYMGRCGDPNEIILPVLQAVVDLAPEVVKYRLALAMLQQELGQHDAAFHVLSPLTPKQLTTIGSANCLRKIAHLFDSVGDTARREACLTRLQELKSC